MLTLTAREPAEERKQGCGGRCLPLIHEGPLWIGRLLDCPKRRCAGRGRYLQVSASPIVVGMSGQRREACCSLQVALPCMPCPMRFHPITFTHHLPARWEQSRIQTHRRQHQSLGRCVLYVCMYVCVCVCSVSMCVHGWAWPTTLRGLRFWHMAGRFRGKVATALVSPGNLPSRASSMGCQLLKGLRIPLGQHSCSYPARLPPPVSHSSSSRH